MTRKFSLAHLTVLGCAPPEMTYIAKMAGYDYISIRPIYMGLPGEPNYDISSNKIMFNQTKKALEETGIQIHDIELARIHDDVNIKDYEAAFEASAKLGAKSVLSSIWTDNKTFYIDKFGELCELAKQYELNVDLEFVTWAGVKDLKETKEVLESVNMENAGIMIDTLHFNRSRVNLKELENLPKEWFHFAHLCDGHEEIPTTKEGLIHTGRDERLYPGEGSINIAEIVSKMPEMVYSLEIPHLKRVEEFGYAEHARRCLVNTKDYLNRNLD
jgi:sugar phosphate isomerase/epimerase